MDVTFKLLAQRERVYPGAGLLHGACLLGEAQQAVQHVAAVEPRSTARRASQLGRGNKTCAPSTNHKNTETS